MYDLKTFPTNESDHKISIKRGFVLIFKIFYVYSPVDLRLKKR